MTSLEAAALEVTGPAERGDRPSREVLLAMLLDEDDLIRHLATSVARKTPGIMIEDLMQAGYLAVLEELDEYDPARGDFRSFLLTRLRSAMLRCGFDLAAPVRLAINARDKIVLWRAPKIIEDLLRTRPSLPKDDIAEAVAAKLKMPLDVVWRNMGRLFPNDLALDAAEPDRIVDENLVVSQTPESLLSARDDERKIAGELRRAIDALPEPQREVAIMRFLERRSLRSVAIALRRAKSSIGLLEREGLAMLAVKLREAGISVEDLGELPSARPAAIDPLQRGFRTSRAASSGESFGRKPKLPQHERLIRSLAAEHRQLTSAGLRALLGERGISAGISTIGRFAKEIGIQLTAGGSGKVSRMPEYEAATLAIVEANPGIDLPRLQALLAARGIAVSSSTVYRLAVSLDLDLPMTPRATGQLAGRETLVRGLLAAAPDMTLGELQSKLAAAGLVVARSSIARSLAAMGMTLSGSHPAAGSRIRPNPAWRGPASASPVVAKDAQFP